MGVEMKFPLKISQKKGNDKNEEMELVIQLVIYLFDHYVYTYVIMRVNKK